MMVTTSSSSGELTKEGIREVLELHKIKLTYSPYPPTALHGECDCGWVGNEYDPPQTASDDEPSRVAVRAECHNHIGDMLLAEAVVSTTR